MFAKKRRKRIRNLLALGISCAIIAFYALNLNLNSLFDTANLASSHSQQPVSILNNVEIRQFDSQGQLRQHLTANRAEMITETTEKNMAIHSSIRKVPTVSPSSKNKKLRLIQPYIIIQDKNSTPLTISASEGLIVGRDKKLQLRGNVKINNIDRQAQVITESLTIDSKTNILSPDQAISIEAPTTTITASGLEANLNNDQWQLLSGAKSVINP